MKSLEKFAVKHPKLVVLWHKTYVIRMAIIGLLTCYFLLFNYVSFQEKGIAWNRITGDLWIQDSGMHITYPWVSVSTIDTRPIRVCIESGSQVSRTCKLVRFDSSHYREFVAVVGHKYFWWSNRFSFNSAYNEEYRGFRDLMRGFAFMPTLYSFVQEERDY